MRLGMVYKVRDEADIIEDNLRYHHALGVDFFVIADTGSTDGTLEILERYERAGLVRVERFEGGMKGMKRGGEEEITRTASEMGADWVIHNDADEFWWPPSGNLKDTFESIPEPFGMVVAPRTEFVSRPGEGPFAERMTLREARFLRPAKTAHRANDRINLRGPHPIEIWSGDTPYRGLVGRPVNRTAAQHREDDPLELLIAPMFPVGVLHFPFRTFEQYRHRVELARDNGVLDRNDEGRAVRDSLENGRLEEVYERLILDDAAAARAIEEGWLAEQTSFRDCLAACPDPLAGGDAGTVAIPGAGDSPSLDELRDDAMYAITRYIQTQASRGRAGKGGGAGKRGGAGKETRDLRRRLKRRSKALRRRTRRLRQVESSLWWKLRPRIPRFPRRLWRRTRRRVRRFARRRRR